MKRKKKSRKKTKRIFIQDWLEFKPYEDQKPTDSIYLTVSNEVNKAIIMVDKIKSYLQPETTTKLACFLTSYFEDIITGTNIWNTFIRMHKKLYKKQLPFYPLSEYIENDLNPQDICFLTWYFLNTIQDEKFVYPFNKFLVEISLNVMIVFNELREYASPNKDLKNYYQLDENEDDFYIARSFIDLILFGSYLFYTDTAMNLFESEMEIINKKTEDIDIFSILDANRDSFLHKSYTRLLALTGKEWAAELLGKEHSHYKDLLNISPKIEGHFLYKGQDKNDVFLEHIASSKKFKLTKKSYDHSDKLKEIDTIVYIGIVQWKNEWWFSGIQFFYPYNADLVLDEKNSAEKRKVVDFLDHKRKDVYNMMGKQLKVFMEYNNGSQIAFLPSEKIEEFFQGYNDYYNKSLNLSDKTIKKVKKRHQKNGFFGKKAKMPNFSEVSDTGLVFFNPKGGIEIALSVNSAFPLPNNPYYKEEYSEDHIMNLLMNDHFSAELVMFCIKNCKNDLPFFKTKIGKKYLEDIDFLLRFWKRKNYFSKPWITLI